MKRIDTSTKHVDKFGAGKHGFKDGNTTTGEPATALNAAFFDAVQEEIAGVIEGAGIALNPAANNQLLAAIAALIVAATPAVAKPGFDVPFLAGYGSTMAAQNLAVRTHGRVVVARAIVLQGQRAVLATAPTGSAAIVDVLANGVSVYTTRPQFAAGATALTAGVLDPARINVAAGATLDFTVTQIGSGAPGQGCAFTLQAREA